MICLDITIQIPGIIGDLDVDRGKPVLIPAGIAARVHAHLFRVSGRLPSSMCQPHSSRATGFT